MKRYLKWMLLLEEITYDSLDYGKLNEVNAELVVNSTVEDTTFWEH